MSAVVTRLYFIVENTIAYAFGIPVVFIIQVFIDLIAPAVEHFYPGIGKQILNFKTVVMRIAIW